MGSHYSHLRLDERRKLANWLEAKMPIAEIADRLGRDASTIYRDIKRNRYTDKEIPELNGYHAVVAQDKYEQRRAIHRKMVVNPKLKTTIEDRLKAGWSPEQIAGRMRLERHPIRVSHETIYRFARRIGKELYREIGAFFIKTLKIFIFSIGLVSILQEWNINVSAFVASLGLGGLASCHGRPTRQLS